MPNQLCDFPDAHMPHRILTVVYAERRLKVNGIAPDFLFHEEDDFFLFEQARKVQRLEPRAENRPVGIVQINMVFACNVLTGAHIVAQIFQLILRVNVIGQNRLFQIFEKVPADNRIPHIDKRVKALFGGNKRHIAAIPVIRQEADGQILKREKVLAEQIRIV